MNQANPCAELAPALRLKILTETVVPCLEKRFAAEPELQSALLLIAQYYSDEADDAVHAALMLSELQTPDFAAYYRAWELNLPDRVNRSHPEDETQAGFFDTLSGSGYPSWDDNELAIPAFASFCQEGVSQHMDETEAYTPYGIFRRTEDGISLDVIGECLRPWLEGIQPMFWDIACQHDASEEQERQQLIQTLKCIPDFKEWHWRQAQDIGL